MFNKKNSEDSKLKENWIYSIEISKFKQMEIQKLFRKVEPVRRI